MKITAFFDSQEAADLAAAQIQAKMPSAHRSTRPANHPNGDEAQAASIHDDWLPGESVPTEVFYARTNGLVNAGFAASAFPGAFSGSVNPPGLYQGAIPYPYLDLAPESESHEAPSEEVRLSIEVGANHVHDAERILINHHGRRVQIHENHK